MRRLHVVGKHEKFVASGVYEVLVEDDPTGLVEYWSVHEVGGAHFVRVDVDGRDFDGRSRLMEALLDPDGRFERIDEHVYDGQSRNPVKTSYTFFDDHVEVLLTVQDDLHESMVELPAGYGVAVDSRFLMGCTVAQAVRNEGETPLFSARWADAAIQGAIVPVRPEYVGQKSVQVAKREINVMGYRWGDNMTVWQDQYGVTISVDTNEGKTILTQYARRPEPTAHD